MSICIETIHEKSELAAGGMDEMTFADLAMLCAEELRQHRQKQPVDGRYCMELARRAIVLRLDEAWEELARQLNDSVLIWLRRHPSYSLAITYDSEENYVALAFTRLWSALRHQHSRFTNLPTLLSYLHATLNSTIIDTMRSYMRVRCVSLLDPAVAEHVDLAVEENYHNDDSWPIFQRLLENENERQLVYLLYYCGLKPREVAARFPAQFGDVKEIYRLNHNIIDRLRRQRERLRWLLGTEDA